MPRISKITIGRLFNLGSYEHVRYELTAEIDPGESAEVAVVAIERILSALNPKMPGSVISEEEIRRKEAELARMIAMPDDEFDRYHRGYVGTRQEYLDRIAEGIGENKVKRAAWLARSKKARQMLNDLGGAAEWKDAKLDWDDYDEF